MERISTKKRERTCISCAKKSTKGQLFRIVRTPLGEVVFDASGRGNGRGAYVCSLACLEKAHKQGRLAKSLKCSVEANAYQNVYDQLSAYLAESVEE